MNGHDIELSAYFALRAMANTPAQNRLLDKLPLSLLNRAAMTARDAAVLDAFNAVGGLQPTPAAKRIATELARYLASAWAVERDRPLILSADPLRAALQRLARANEGEPIGSRQLLNIRDGRRR